MKNMEIKKEITWEKVVLECGRIAQANLASGSYCGNCESNTNTSGQATCC